MCGSTVVKGRSLFFLRASEVITECSDTEPAMFSVSECLSR